jgi:hypothetical protein
MPEAPFVYFAWDLEVPGLGEVWLRAENRSGYPTQTWLNGVLILREPEGEYAWDTEAGVPVPVSMMDRTVEAHQAERRTLCYLIRLEVKLWDGFAVKTEEMSEPFRARAAGYAHYGRLLMEAHGCT